MAKIPGKPVQSTIRWIVLSLRTFLYTAPSIRHLSLPPISWLLVAAALPATMFGSLMPVLPLGIMVLKCPSHYVPKPCWMAFWFFFFLLIATLALSLNEISFITPFSLPRTSELIPKLLQVAISTTLSTSSPQFCSQTPFVTLGGFHTNRIHFLGVTQVLGPRPTSKGEFSFNLKRFAKKWTSLPTFQSWALLDGSEVSVEDLLLVRRLFH